MKRPLSLDARALLDALTERANGGTSVQTTRVALAQALTLPVEFIRVIAEELVAKEAIVEDRTTNPHTYHLLPIEPCLHPSSRSYGDTQLDPESPTLESTFIGCCDCGAIVYRGNWRLRKPRKDEIKRDRAKVLASIAPEVRAFWDASRP